MKEIQELLEITIRLREKYKHHGKNFTLDGRLVGDIGEVLVAEKYGLELYKENHPIHDSEEIATGRKVQIKSTFKGYCYFPYGDNNIPDYYLCVKIQENGDLDEIFNGPGEFVVENYIRPRKLKPYKNSYYTLSKNILQKLNNIVPAEQKIKIVKGESH
ncbi:MAG TPA: hypothetical protein PLH30_05365 [Bacteroidales bacterium]|nr:hypothetical protein [Bacteroidales bacterium]